MISVLLFLLKIMFFTTMRNKLEKTNTMKIDNKQIENFVEPSKIKVYSFDLERIMMYLIGVNKGTARWLIVNRNLIVLKHV